jgi:hypothetical protein
METKHKIGDVINLTKDIDYWNGYERKEDLIKALVSVSFTATIIEVHSHLVGCYICSLNSSLYPYVLVDEEGILQQ